MTRAVRWKQQLLGGIAACFVAGWLPAYAQSSAGHPVTLKTVYGTEAWAYVAGPDEAAVGLVLLHDRFGLDKYTLAAADKLAAAGYRVVAVDLFDGRTNTDPDLAERQARAIDPVWSEANVRAALDYLNQAPRKLGVIGWGYGGGVAMYASTIIDLPVTAVVNYYGTVPTDTRGLTRIRTAVMGVFAANDPAIPDSAIASFENGMRIFLHPVAILRSDQPRGFANPGYATFNQEAEQNAWRRVTEFLAENIR